MLSLRDSRLLLKKLESWQSIVAKCQKHALAKTNQWIATRCVATLAMTMQVFSMTNTNCHIDEQTLEMQCQNIPNIIFLITSPP